MKRSNLILTHKILFYFTIFVYLADLILYGTALSILGSIWVTSAIAVFVMSVIILGRKPDKKAFPITTLVITSIPTALFLYGVFLGVMGLV